MNMNLSELINEILSEWAFRVDDGMPNPKNPIHLKELGIVLSEMGLSHIKKDLVENLLTEKGKTPENVKEADKSFTNPILNKKVSYKDKQGNDKEGIVGNLLRQPEGTPARDAAEKVLPPEGSPERDAINQDLGGEGKPQGAEEPKGDKGGAEGGAPKEDPIQKAAPMYDPKADPAMGQRLAKEKETQAQLAKDAEEKDTEADKEIKPKEDTDFNPIPAQDVQNEIPQADPETFGAASDIPDGVDKEDLQKFNTDISKVQKMVDDAISKGEKAPNINLCQITVPGTNLYCDDNLGIPRSEMPQFKGKAQPGTRAADMPTDKGGEVDTEPVFREMLKQKNIKVTQTEVPADKLKATQSELVGAKVVGMMGALEENPEHEKITAPIYVSRDGYVIDGHHRWAAVAAYNAKHPEKQIPMKVQVLDQDIKDAIPMANKFAEDMGIAAKKADANKETPDEQPKQVSSLDKKGLTQKIKDKISKWHKEEKEFFEKGYYKAGSEPRRELAQAIKDKAKGAWKAIKHGAQHEIAEFKEAGKGVGKFFKGEKLNDHEKDALKSVGIKIATTAIFGAAMGGLSHGAAAFAKHVAVEFVPHVIGETILKGAGRAALFADIEGEAEMDANMEKFAELIAKGLEDMEISQEQMEDMIDSYNEKKDKNEMQEIKEEHLPLIDSLIEGIINDFIEEANPIQKTDDVLNQYVKYKDEKGDHEVKVSSALKYKNSANKGQVQAYNQAVKLLKKSGVSDKELGKSKQPKPTVAQDKDVQARVGREKTALAKIAKEKEPKVPAEKGSGIDMANKAFAASTLQKSMEIFSKDEKKIFKSFMEDVKEFYSTSNTSKKAQLGAQLVDKYKLYGSSNEKKVYLGIFGGNDKKSHAKEKILGGGNAFTEKLLADLKSTGANLGGGSKKSSLSDSLAKSAKPDLKDKSVAYDAKGNIKDKFIANLFSTEPLSFLDKKFYELHGPLDANGNLIGPSGGKNAKLYLQHSIKNNESIKRTIDELKKYPEINPKVIQALQDHQSRMENILKKYTIPSKQAAQAVGDSYGMMAQGIATNSDKTITGALMKQFAEMSLYDTEIAAGDECYLPSVGNFPSGDKLKISRKSGTKIERVSSVSVKYGLSGDQYSNYGFPGETAQYQKYHPNPDYRNRNASHPGVYGYTMGVRNDLIDNDKQFAKMFKESGFEKHLKNGKADLPSVLQVIKNCKKEMQKVLDGAGAKSLKDLNPLFDRMKEVNQKYADNLNKYLKSDKELDAALGYDNTLILKQGPMAFAMACSWGATLNTGNGLNTIEHNHQVIDSQGKYHSSTDVGSTNLKLWKLNFRAFDNRGGGLTTSYNSARTNINAWKNGYDVKGNRILKK